MLAHAHTYQGAGTISVAAGCSAAVGTPIVPGSKARILADGVAAAPADAPALYANAGHAYIEVAGIYLDTAAGLGNPPNPLPTGPRSD